MHWNLVDVAVLAYMAYGLVMGYVRGMAKEVPWALGWAVSLLTGTGIYRWTTRGMEQLSEATGLTFGIVGLIFVFVGGYFLVRRIRWRIRTYLETRFTDAKIQKTGGMIAGAVRTLLLSSFLIIFVMLLPVGPLRAPLKEGSFFGRVLNRIVLPVVKITQGEEPPRPASAKPAPRSRHEQQGSKNY